MLVTAVLADLTRAGVNANLAAGLARGAMPSLQNLLEHGVNQPAPEHLWMAARRDGDGHKVEAFQDEAQLDASGATIVLMIDLAAITKRTLERIVKDDIDTKMAKVKRQLCPDCLARLKPSDIFAYCQHRQTVAMADYSEAGALLGFKTWGPLTEAQFREAVARYMASHDKKQ